MNRASPSQAKEIAKCRSIAAYNASTATAPPEAVKRWTEKPAALATPTGRFSIDMPCPVRRPRDSLKDLALAWPYSFRLIKVARRRLPDRKVEPSAVARTRAGRAAMTNGDKSSRSDRDILIAGAGLAGLTAAYGMARAGFDVACCGAAERTGRGRTVALLNQSVAFLKSLGVWADLEARAAPLRSLRLIDDTGAFFPPRPVEFHAAEFSLDAFGWNIENDLMAEALAAKVAQIVGLERVAM